MPYIRAKVSDDARFNAACNHYKDTYEIHAKTLQQRDNTFLVTLLVAATFALQIPYSDFVHAAIISLIANSPTKIALPVGGNFITSMLWVLLLGTAIRYFQLAIQVERQYEYLHRLEDDLRKNYASTSFFTREGTSYLKNYPAYSNWIWLLYTTIFPLLLLTVIGFHIKSEVELSASLSLIAADLICCLLICITTLLYLARIHFGRCSD